MTKKRKLENRISNLISSKELSEYKINKAYNLLDYYKSLENFNLSFYHLQKAKILFRLNHISEAKEELLYVDKNSAYYYLLFKINIKENNLEYAAICLKKYKLEHYNNEINISLCLYLIELLNNKKTNINIEVTNYYNGSYITDNYLINMLHTITDLILKENYEIAKRLITKCQFYINKNNISVDFTELLSLVNLFIKKEKVVNIDIDTLIRETYSYISKGELKKASSLLDNIRNHSKFKNVSYDYKLLKRYLNEELLKSDLINSELKEKYESIKIWSEIHSCYEDTYTECQYYLYGIYITNSPEFYYKAGVCYFKMGNLKKASKYFLSYIRNGGFEYLIETYEYLSHCKYLINANDRYNYRLKKEKVCNFFKKTSGIRKSFELDLNINLEKVYDSKMINYILSNFNLCSNYQKIKDIKYLYEKGYIELAETLYREFYSDISGDESLYKERFEMESDRIIYVSKAKKLIL